MQSTGAKIALAVGSIAVLVVLFVALNSGGDDSGSNSDNAATSTTTTTPADTTTTTRPEPPPVPVIRVRDNEPVGGVRKLSVEKGERVKFDVRSNTETSIHVHVYDIEKTIPAGGKTRFSFKADIEGVFEIEDHVSNELVASLRVTP